MAFLLFEATRTLKSKYSSSLRILMASGVIPINSPSRANLRPSSRDHLFGGVSNTKLHAKTPTHVGEALILSDINFHVF